MTEGLQRQKWDRSGIKSRQAEYKIRNILIKRNESLRSLNWQVLNVIFNLKKTSKQNNKKPTTNQHKIQTPHRTKPPSNTCPTTNPLDSQYQILSKCPHFYPAEALFCNFQQGHCTSKHFTWEVLP